MKSKISQTAKDLLQKLLKEHLDNNLIDLELKNKKEFNTLLLINNASKNLSNCLIELSENSLKYTSQIRVPKIKIPFNSNQSKKFNKNKSQRSKKDEIYIEIDSILRNKNHHNKRNREDPQLPSQSNTRTNVKSKVSFIDKNCMSKPKTNVTPDQIKRNKNFILNNNTSNKKGKEILRKKKTLVTPLKICEKTKKKYFKKIPSLIINNNDNVSRTSKKMFKTMTNFHINKNKHNLTSVNDNKLVDNDNDINMKNIFDKNEQTLNNLCDSLLIDVNKDELLINNSPIILNDGNEIIHKNESINNEDTKEKTLNNNYLYDKLKLCINSIIDYLTLHDILSLCQTKKELLKNVISIKIEKTKALSNNINLFLKNKNLNINDPSLPKKIKPFELNSTSLRAITTLNSISKPNFIKSIMSVNESKTLNNNAIRKIILIFDIYFIALGKKNIINNFNGNNTKKLDYICNYFKNSKIKSIGSIIQNDLTGKKFDDLIINTLYEYSHEYINIINPGYYKRINKDIAIFVFLIKNILDYIGITNYESNEMTGNNKNSDQKIILVNKSRIKANNMLLDIYNQILKKFY